MRRYFPWIIIFAAFSAHGWGQSAPISGQVFDQYGSPVAGAQVYICSASASTGLPCTPTATIYSDYNLQNVTANPTTTDANGNFNVYVGALAFPNVYVVNAVPVAVGQPYSGTPYTWLYPGPNCPLSGCTFTGLVTAPTFNATSSPYYEVNGSQIASTNLADSANLARLNASNIFTGTTQTAPIWDATSGFQVNGIALASTNLSDSSNLARLNASNDFTGATNTFSGIVGTTINATSGFEVNGVALSASNLSNGVSGTGAVCLASGSACNSGGTVTLVGLSSTTLTIGGSPVTVSGTMTVNLPNSGVTAGSYNAANITVDQYGRVTAASSGVTNSCTSYSSTSSAGCTITADGKWLEWVTGPTEGANFTGEVVVALPVTLPTACYTSWFNTSLLGSTISHDGQGYNNYLGSCTTTTVTIEMESGADGVGQYSHAAVAYVLGH